MKHSYTTLQEALSAELKNKDFKKEYDNLESWRALQVAFINARNSQNITQEQLAKRLNMKRANVARLESSLNANPTFETLCKYAKALGLKKLEIVL